MFKATGFAVAQARKARAIFVAGLTLMALAACGGGAQTVDNPLPQNHNLPSQGLVPPTQCLRLYFTVRGDTVLELWDATMRLGSNDDESPDVRPDAGWLDDAISTTFANA